MDWRPPRRFDMVRTGLEYVPRPERGAFLDHLWACAVAPGGRQVVGVCSEEWDRDDLADEVRGLGHRIAGRVTAPHRHPVLAYKALWLGHAT